MPKFKFKGQELLFLHIPKTGGTSIESWLSTHCEISYYSTVIPTFMKCSPQHLTIDYLLMLEPNLDIPTFTVVRDPYDRAESEYFFRTGNQQPQLRPNFSAWMLKHLHQLNRNPHHLDNHLMPQWYFINESVDVHRYEDGLGRLFENLTKTYHIPKPKEIPHTNASPRAKVTWSSELLDRFHKHYAVDFEKLEYKMHK